MGEPLSVRTRVVRAFRTRPLTRLGSPACPGEGFLQISVRGSLQVSARIENLGDVLNAQRGFFKLEMVHAVDVADALIAPGTSCFALPARLITQLKLQRRGTRKA